MDDDSAANRLVTRSYEQFEHPYKTGYNSFLKYPGQNFDDVEDDIALGYEEAKTRFGIAMGHSGSRSQRGLGQIGRNHQPARSQPRRARVALAK